MELLKWLTDVPEWANRHGLNVNADMFKFKVQVLPDGTLNMNPSPLVLRLLSVYRAGNLIEYLKKNIIDSEFIMTWNNFAQWIGTEEHGKGWYQLVKLSNRRRVQDIKKGESVSDYFAVKQMLTRLQVREDQYSQEYYDEKLLKMAYKGLDSEIKKEVRCSYYVGNDEVYHSPGQFLKMIRSKENELTRDIRYKVEPSIFLELPDRLKGSESRPTNRYLFQQDLDGNKGQTPTSIRHVEENSINDDEWQNVEVVRDLGRGLSYFPGLFRQPYSAPRVQKEFVKDGKFFVRNEASASKVMDDDRRLKRCFKCHSDKHLARDCELIKLEADILQASVDYSIMPEEYEFTEVNGVTSRHSYPPCDICGIPSHNEKYCFINPNGVNFKPEILAKKNNLEAETQRRLALANNNLVVKDSEMRVVKRSV